MVSKSLLGGSAWATPLTVIAMADCVDNYEKGQRLGGNFALSTFPQRYKSETSDLNINQVLASRKLNVLYAPIFQMSHSPTKALVYRTQFDV